MTSSWRPFASNFVNHAFENYIKRYDRSETAPSDQPKLKKAKFDINELFPYKNSKIALEERMQKFQELQKRVQRQRVLIKNRDKVLERNRTLRKELETTQRVENQNQKKQMLNHIRSFHRDIPSTVPQRLNHRKSDRSERGSVSKSQIVERESPSGGIFSLTSALELKPSISVIAPDKTMILPPLPELRKDRTGSLPPIKKSLNTSLDLNKSLRQHQDKILKKLSGTVPSYRQELKKELDKIHSQASMTYEEHQQRNKIRRSHQNPYTRRV